MRRMVLALLLVFPLIPARAEAVTIRDIIELTKAGLGENVLLVGHDPDFSMAVHDLTGAQARMKKGGLAGVEKGEIKVLLRPDDLAAMAS